MKNKIKFVPTYNYTITNIKNGKVYIGETMNVERRWKEHKESLDKKAHYNYKLQNDWSKYGEESFKFEIMPQNEYQLTITNSIRSKAYGIYVENKIIKELNLINDGYNIEETVSLVLNGQKKIYEKSKRTSLILQCCLYELTINNGEYDNTKVKPATLKDIIDYMDSIPERLIGEHKDKIPLRKLGYLKQCEFIKFLGKDKEYFKKQFSYPTITIDDFNILMNEIKNGNINFLRYVKKS